MLIFVPGLKQGKLEIMAGELALETHPREPIELHRSCARVRELVVVIRAVLSKNVSEVRDRGRAACREQFRTGKSTSDPAMNFF